MPDPKYATHRLRTAVAAILFAALPGMSAAAGFTVTGSAYVDQDSGESYDLDLRLRPSDAWSVSAGIGRSATAGVGNDFDGTSWRASAGWQGERLGVALNTRNWRDGGQFESRNIGADFTVLLPAGFVLTGLLRQRDLDLDYTITGALGRVFPASASFTGRGYGAELGWSNQAWNASVRAVGYSYDDALDRVIAAAAAPTTRFFPRVQALADSMLTRAFGATERELSVSVDRSFARSGLRLDLSNSREALTGTTANGIAASYRYTISPRVEFEGTVGVSDGDSLDAVTYGGLAATLRL